MPCVLRRRALQAFCGRVHVGTGVGASMAVGHIGRQAEAALRLGVSTGGAICYSYSLTSGIFAGNRMDTQFPCLPISIKLYVLLGLCGPVQS